MWSGLEVAEGEEEGSRRGMSVISAGLSLSYDRFAQGLKRHLKV